MCALTNEDVEMKPLLALLAPILLSGCATVFSDHEQEVSFTADTPTRYTVTNQAGRQVAGGVTPSKHTLNAAAGYFDVERYPVQAGNKKIIVDSSVSPWYWAGFLWPFTSMLIIDPLTGDMYELPDNVDLGDAK